jgi:phage shock protein A
MGIRTRLSTIFKSNVNHLVTCAEDPEKIINQSLEEMEDSFDAAKKRVMTLKNEIEDNQRYKKNILEQIEYWAKKTEEFVNGDMDENAKQAIRKRRILEEIDRKLEYRISELQTRFKDVEKKLKEAEGRLLIAKNKRKILLSSYGAAKNKDTEITSNTGFTEKKTAGDPYETFMKMEERISDEQQLLDIKSSREDELLEKEESLINEELENIKKQLKGGKK